MDKILGSNMGRTAKLPEIHVFSTTRYNIIILIGKKYQTQLGMSCLMKEKPHSRNTPNILWICTDQQRYDTVNCLGNPHIHTPNLDRFAAESVEVEYFYVCPVCAPTRASLSSRLYPSRH